MLSEQDLKTYVANASRADMSPVQRIRACEFEIRCLNTSTDSLTGGSAQKREAPYPNSERIVSPPHDYIGIGDTPPSVMPVYAAANPSTSSRSDIGRGADF